MAAKSQNPGGAPPWPPCSKGYCIKGFSYDLHKSQNEKFVRNRKKSNWDLDPDFCSKTILTIFLEMTIRCIFLEMSKTNILGRFFFRQNPIRGNEEILCIQNTKDFFISPYEVASSSYESTFFQKLPNISELFSKMNFSNDFGFFANEKYMPIVLGKIAKSSQRHLELVVKYEDVFSWGFLSAGPPHLPGEREVMF